MTQATQQIDPESLVAQIVRELEGNRAAQDLLLRTLLTNEFLGIPARLDALEATVREMKIDIEEIKNRLSGVENRLGGVENRLDGLNSRTERLEIHVAGLRGDNLEFKLPKRIVPLLSGRLRLRRGYVMHSTLNTDTTRVDIIEEVACAAESGVITEKQETRVLETDLIMRAQSRDDRSFVWLAVEASGVIHRRDIGRAVESAEALEKMFDQNAIPVVVGYNIRPEDQRRADEMGVKTLIVEEFDY